MASSSTPLKSSSLKPYLSFAVFVQPEGGSEGSTAAVVRDAARSFVEDSNRRRLLAEGIKPTGDGSYGSVTTSLVMSHLLLSEPSWGRVVDPEIKERSDDRVNHLTVILEHGPLIAVHTTDDPLKENLFRKQQRLQLGGAGLLKRGTLEEALLGGEIATFWMGHGAAHRGLRGPRSKTHYGPALEETIDPIGDSRHTLSAARAKIDGTPLDPAEAGGVVGANLKRSSFWFRRSSNWTDFLHEADKFLGEIGRVISSSGGRERFAVFARHVDSLDGVERAYDLAVETPVGDPGLVGGGLNLEAYEWVNAVVKEVEGTNGRTARVKLDDPGGGAAELSIRPERSNSNIVFTHKHVSGDEEVSSRWFSLADGLGLNLYYESGETVSRDDVLVEHFSDVPFSQWDYVDLEGTDDTREKTGGGTLDEIRNHGGSAEDDSLFGWIIRNHRSGYLYCDDGADELADFVYFDPISDIVTVWHVKAAERPEPRRISAGAYEQVCSQTEKNLKTLTLSGLTQELQAKVRNNKTRVLWVNGQLDESYEAFLAELTAPRAGLRFEARILCPHVTRTSLEKARSNAAKSKANQRLRRLDQLLLATDASVQRVGARLSVVTWS